MSLAMMALRIAAVQALKGATLVGGNVLDSEIAALDLTANGALKTDQEKPFIAIYTEGANVGDTRLTGLRSNGAIEVVFNFGIAASMTVSDPENGLAVVEGYPGTDANFEMLLDAISCQICRALVDPENAWAQVWTDLVQEVVAKVQRRNSTSDRVRMAAGQVVLTVNALADPLDDRVLQGDGPWKRLVDLAATDGLPQAALLSDLIGAQNVDLYDRYESLLGLSGRDAASLKLYDYADVGLSGTVTEVASDVDID